MRARGLDHWLMRGLSLQEGDRPGNTIRTARLVLRPLGFRDARDFYGYAQDPAVARYVLWDPHTSLMQTRSILRGLIADSHLEGLHTLAITLRESGRMVGTIGLVNRDRQNMTAEVGFSLARDCWGRGLMTEALTAYLRYLFALGDINRVEAQHDALNPASGAVMQKAGMQKEGRLNGRVRYKGRTADVLLYAALRDAWLASHQEGDKTGSP